MNVLVILVVFICGVYGSTFIGVGTSRCQDFSCKRLYVAMVDSESGLAKNITSIPDDLLDHQTIDLIHTVADNSSNLLYLIYSNLVVNENESVSDTSFIVTYDITKSVFTVKNMEDTLKAAYSMCYSGGDYIYGLGWLPTDTPFSLTAFSIKKDDFQVEAIAKLPGVYSLVPECAVNPMTNKIYFYYRSTGPAPTLNIWEVDLEQNIFSQSWSINTSLWEVPYLFQYDPISNKMMALLEDGLLSTWLVSFDPTSNEPDPFTKILKLPDDLVPTSALSYDTITSEFVFVTFSEEIISVGTSSVNRQTVTGVPDHFIRKISWLSGN